MKIVIVTHSSPYEARAKAIQQYCKANGFESLCVFSDFDHHAHRTRQNLTEKDNETVYLPMTPYQRNLSVRRMKSIYDFAGRVEKYLETIDFDILYVMVPANSLAAMAQRLKKKRDFKLVMDIMDLWPEALPLEKVEWMPPLQFWKHLRDRSLPSADVLVTECRFFRDFLRLPQEKTHTLYWVDQSIITVENADQAANEKADEAALQRTGEDILKVVYIGAINNIIDIASITAVLSALKKRCRVQMHVVGDGEGREALLKSLRDHGIDYRYHGKVYEARRKKEILEQCDFGINMMKKSVKVGLTMKSVDYLAHGLPLINNIRGDTWEMIAQTKAGVNVSKGKNAFAQAAEEIIAGWQEIDALQKQARYLYRTTFTKESFENTLSEILK